METHEKTTNNMKPKENTTTEKAEKQIQKNQLRNKIQILAYQYRKCYILNWILIAAITVICILLTAVLITSLKHKFGEFNSSFLRVPILVIIFLIAYNLLHKGFLKLEKKINNALGWVIIELFEIDLGKENVKRGFKVNILAEQWVKRGKLIETEFEYESEFLIVDKVKVIINQNGVIETDYRVNGEWKNFPKND